MVTKPNSNQARLKRHARVRSKVSGTAQRPRLDVFRSNCHIYAQLIDDVNGVTLAAAGSNEKDFGVSGGNCEGARKVGQLIAERAAAKGISEVVFDRGGYIFHGRVKELAEGAREGGLKF
ncbi:MAG: 50S ribosomal protein L18 [Clostridia bacterium]|nr:50S ribosomal protein L18 [Clostridia bacterium]